jgi:hypothetical protein
MQKERLGRSTWEQAINAQTEYGLPGGTEQAWPIGQANGTDLEIVSKAPTIVTVLEEAWQFVL